MRRNNGVRVPHKKRDGVKVYHEKESDGDES